MVNLENVFLITEVRESRIMSRRCTFKEEWKINPEFRDWIGHVTDNVHRAYCKICKKAFDVGNMGISAVKSHAKGQGHKRVMSSQGSGPRMTDFISQSPTPQNSEASRQAAESESQGSSEVQPSTSVTPPQATPTIGAHFSSEAVLEAEIRWVIKVALSKYSFNSCSDMGSLFHLMFPDSEIAQKFSCGATKAAYLMCFGLAPYFRDNLVKDIRQSNCYTISFDECLNKITQTEQMDVLVRYWSDNEEKVVVHYLDSQFLGHTQSEKLVESIKVSLSPLDPNKLLQISMDGPSVNKNFLRLFEEDRTKEAPDIRSLINLGTCGLHTVHGSFQQGEKESGWKIGDKLRALWQLFHDTPARRDDFIEITKTSTFPLKFCAHRWVEDLPVAERALKMWPHVEIFVDNYKKLPKSKMPAGDPLFEAQLQFFVYVARQLKPFLETFQTDAPMMPFLAKDLQALLKSLISCFMKREVLDNIKTPVQMLKIDVLDKTLHLPLKEVDLGFATKQALEKASEKLLEKPLPGQQFWRECVAFLSATAKKLLDKCPLNYAAVRHMACLDLVTMISDERRVISMFEKLLQLLLNAKWHTAEDCDQILSEYKMFLTEMVQHHKEEFQGYRSSSCRLDTFMGRFAGGKAEYAILWKSMKDLFTLSHGQAAVERGYSVNKDMLVTNLKGRTLMSLRLIQDSLTGGSFDGVLPKPLLQHCRNARMRYVQYLDDEKKKKKETKNDKQREELRSEITKVAAKRQKIITSIEAMQEEADAMAEKAERKQDFTLLTKSNACRKSVSEKKKEVIGLDAVLSDLKEQHQHCF